MSLAPVEGVIWLAVASTPSTGLEQVLPRLSAIVRFTGELDARLRGAGIGGLVPARELGERVATLLAAVAPDADRAQGAVAALIGALRAMQASLEALRRIKSELAPAP